uniref:Uncharacterized protein n=1 Tax=Rhizochromulina marina TaxID=1034831 RepID=A0A7S2SHC1_9STRA|mmetsp:Transcript_30214/g.88000  ORF Transcript_30214/g.88000 Transcript_30214/m.88000 type:complete len:307 (+) Transcript_30214:71-991(+)
MKRWGPSKELEGTSRQGLTSLRRARPGASTLPLPFLLVVLLFVFLPVSFFALHLSTRFDHLPDSFHEHRPPLAKALERPVIVPREAGGEHRGALHIQGRDDIRHTKAGSHLCDQVEFGSFDPVAGLGSASSTMPLPLAENLTVHGVVPLHQYHYYQVCVATHPDHFQRVEFHLSGDHNAIPSIGVVAGARAVELNPDLYISGDNPSPTFDHTTWISAGRTDEFISLPTYVEDFLRAPSISSGNGKILYVGVYGRDVTVHGVPDPTVSGVPYTLRVSMRSVPEREVQRRSSLRGGRRLHPLSKTARA